MTFVVTAQYEAKLDERRERRIHDAFERCGVRHRVVGDFAAGQAPLIFSDFEWMQNEDGSGTDLTIYVDEHERAVRLASELRACGLVVGIAADKPGDE